MLEPLALGVCSPEAVANRSGGDALLVRKHGLARVSQGSGRECLTMDWKIAAKML